MNSPESLLEKMQRLYQPAPPKITLHPWAEKEKISLGDNEPPPGLDLNPDTAR